MANPQHIEWLLEGVEAWNKRRSETEFKPDLSGENLRELFNQAARLRSDRRLLMHRPDLWPADLTEAELRALDLHEAIHRSDGRTPLHKANLRGADLRGANLRDADLREADLMEADLQKAELWSADLREADLQKADLQGADLRDADLQRADLREAALTEADVQEVALQGADLRGANLRGVNLRAANLQGADLREADVREADVTSLLYSMVGSIRSNPEYTDLSTALHLTQTQLDRMKGDSGTLLPDGLTRPAHWPDLDETDPGPPSDAVTAIPDRSPQAPTEAPSKEPEPPLQTRIQFHLTHARTASLNAQTVAALIDAETTYLRQTSNQLGPEIDLFEDLSALLKTFAMGIETPGADVSALERQLEEAKTKIEDLTAQLEEAEKARKSPSAFSEEFQKSAGKALGVAVIAAPLGVITGGLTYLLGTGSQASLAAFGTAAATSGIGALK